MNINPRIENYHLREGQGLVKLRILWYVSTSWNEGISNVW